MLLSVIDIIVLLFFFTCWVGYSLFARKRARTTHCLSSILCELRIDWMRNVMHKDNQIADASLIGNVERTVTFFASSTILVLAGVITVLAHADQVVNVLNELPLTPATHVNMVQFKLAVLALIFIYAFFKFTWSIRQFGFVSVLLGVSVNYQQNQRPEEEREEFARHAAKVLDQSGHEYNKGLRTYYFALAYMSWFLHPIMLVLSSAIVVWVLYRREYKSRVLRDLLATKGFVPGKKVKE
ncbi:putative membrane protein [Idiomarina fontislapidosi]|uniref:DUF599 domain-containing protein n=1 Tax=Idiomarina fontislapidosi TaxID=263723 RepID=A0A432XS75_9GAMM|nr:DUF599 domain-containing protein [Idiomarina fontislapidosi]PYE31171.1 putative membrane protein [Idiomarina fontislapidosi]RUO51431.1 DUF599 domain-containing protein [Idiomarina fontislapidosi]